MRGSLKMSVALNLFLSRGSDVCTMYQMIGLSNQNRGEFVIEDGEKVVTEEFWQTYYLSIVD